MLGISQQYTCTTYRRGPAHSLHEQPCRKLGQRRTHGREGVPKIPPSQPKWLHNQTMPFSTGSNGKLFHVNFQTDSLVLQTQITTYQSRLKIVLFAVCNLKQFSLKSKSYEIAFIHIPNFQKCPISSIFMLGISQPYTRTTCKGGLAHSFLCAWGFHCCEPTVYSWGTHDIHEQHVHPPWGIHGVHVQPCRKFGLRALTPCYSTPHVRARTI